MHTTFTTDTNGNVTRYDYATGSDDKFIDWNARNLPTAVVIGSSLTDTTPTAKDEFAYGPDGERFYKKATWDDGGTQRVEHTFYVGAFEELITYSGHPSYQSIKKTRVDSSVVHLRKTNHSAVSTDSIEYLHRDHLGSIEAVSDSSGAVLQQLGYDPFGGRRTSDWARELTPAEKEALADADDPAVRGYTDHEMLDRTGLVHMNGRVYDPELGRFISPDPIVQAPGHSQSWNRYAYVMNSPMSYTDPSGYIRQPSSAGDICAASPACLNFNGPFGGPAGASIAIGVPSVHTDVLIFEERRLGRLETIRWPRVYGWGNGGNDTYGYRGLLDRILRIEIDTVELIDRRVETVRTQTVATTESGETDEATAPDSRQAADPFKDPVLARMILTHPGPANSQFGTLGYSTTGGVDLGDRSEIAESMVNQMLGELQVMNKYDDYALIAVATASAPGVAGYVLRGTAATGRATTEVLVKGIRYTQSTARRREITATAIRLLGRIGSDVDDLMGTNRVPPSIPPAWVQPVFKPKPNIPNPTLPRGQ